MSFVEGLARSPLNNLAGLLLSAQKLRRDREDREALGAALKGGASPLEVATIALGQGNTQAATGALALQKAVTAENKDQAEQIARLMTAAGGGGGMPAEGFGGGGMPAEGFGGGGGMRQLASLPGVTSGQNLDAAALADPPAAAQAAQVAQVGPDRNVMPERPGRSTRKAWKPDTARRRETLDNMAAYVPEMRSEPPPPPDRSTLAAVAGEMPDIRNSTDIAKIDEWINASMRETERNMHAAGERGGPLKRLENMTPEEYKRHAAGEMIYDIPYPQRKPPAPQRGLDAAALADPPAAAQAALAAQARQPALSRHVQLASAGGAAPGISQEYIQTINDSISQNPKAWQRIMGLPRHRRPVGLDIRNIRGEPYFSVLIDNHKTRTRGPATVNASNADDDKVYLMPLRNLPSLLRQAAGTTAARKPVKRYTSAGDGRVLDTITGQLVQHGDTFDADRFGRFVTNMVGGDAILTADRQKMVSTLMAMGQEASKRGLNPHSVATNAMRILAEKDHNLTRRIRAADSDEERNAAVQALFDELTGGRRQ